MVNSGAHAVFKSNCLIDRFDINLEVVSNSANVALNLKRPIQRICRHPNILNHGSSESVFWIEHHTRQIASWVPPVGQIIRSTRRSARRAQATLERLLARAALCFNDMVRAGATRSVWRATAGPCGLRG